MKVVITEVLMCDILTDEVHKAIRPSLQRDNLPTPLQKRLRIFSLDGRIITGKSFFLFFAVPFSFQAAMPI
jgi:hypothetical protein